MRIVSIFFFASLSIVGSAPYEQFHALYKDFQNKASQENANSLHTWINKEHNAVLHKYSMHYVKQYHLTMRGELLYVSLPSEIRCIILTNHIFHDDGTAFKVFESLPYAKALKHLNHYNYTSELSKSIQPWERFLLKEDQVSAVRTIKNCNFIWDDRNGYQNVCATILAAGIRYPLKSHNTHYGPNVNAILKTIEPYVFKILGLEGMCIACNNNESTAIGSMITESAYESMHHYPVILCKQVIDTALLAYNLCNNNNIAGLAASLALDGAIMRNTFHFLSMPDKDDVWEYYQQRLFTEMIIYTSAYMIGQSFNFPSIMPYLLLTTACWYYVRTNERFPHTFVLGQPEKQKNLCTIV